MFKISNKKCFEMGGFVNLQISELVKCKQMLMKIDCSAFEFENSNSAFVLIPIEL